MTDLSQFLKTERNKGIFLYRYILINVKNAKLLKKNSSLKFKSGPIEPESMAVVSTFSVEFEDRKRQHVDLIFQFVCVLIGFEFSMIFTNWTTISDNQQTENGSIVDTKTFWIRFAGTMVGLVYVLLNSASDLMIKSNERRSMKRLTKSNLPENNN